MKYNYSEPHSQNRYFVAFLLLMWLFSPYKTAYLPECKHSQNAVLHGSEKLQKSIAGSYYRLIKS